MIELTLEERKEIRRNRIKIFNEKYPDRKLCEEFNCIIIGPETTQEDIYRKQMEELDRSDIPRYKE